MTTTAVSLDAGPDENGLRPLIGRASLVGAGTAWQQGLSFLTGLLVARMLGAADFGMLNLARSLADTTGIVTRLGLDIGLQRHMGESATSAARQARAALLAKLRLLAGGFALLPALAVALGIGAALEADVYRYDRFSETLLCLLLVLPFATDLAVLGGAYRGVLRLAPAVTAEYFLLPTIRLAAIVVLFLAGWRLWAVVAGSMLATLLASLWLARAARRDFPSVAAGAFGGWPEARRVVGYSSVLSAAVLVTALTGSIDLLLLGHFGSAVETGQYALVKTLLLMMGVFGVAFGQGLGALVAERHARGDTGGMAAVMSLTARWIALVTAPLFALFLFWGSEFTRLFGPSFHAPQGVVAALALGQYLIAILGPVGWALSMTGRHFRELGILTAGLAVATVAGALAIPAWGQWGAALATLAAIAVANLGRVLAARAVVGRLPVGGDVLRITALGIGLAAFFELATSSLSWPAPVCAACAAGGFLLSYAACAWHFLLDAGEKRQLHGACRALAGRLAGKAR